MLTSGQHQKDSAVAPARQVLIKDLGYQQSVLTGDCITAGDICPYVSTLQHLHTTTAGYNHVLTRERAPL